MSKELILRLIGPLVTALGISLQELRRSRNEYARRKMARDEATEMVAFIEKWVQAQQLTCASEEFEAVKQIARLQLQQVYALLMNAQQTKAPPKRPLLRRVFLLYQPASLGGWISHIIFYLLIVVLGMFSLGVFTDEKDPEITRADIIAIYVFYLFITFAVRAWAVHIETRRELKSSQSAPPGPALNG